MPIQKVTKGNRVDLTKDTGLQKARIGLGWDKIGRASCRERVLHTV